ncbi:MAG TPA: TatD family hydrolase [Anaerolineales bacterium]|nr:TatD family hydrolase [Anaerolineales bacterium]
MEATDTHCHLDFDRFDGDRDQVIDRAREVKIVRILNPGIDVETSRKAITLSEQYPEIYASVGIHPNEALSYSQDSRRQLLSMAFHPKVIAIGEIGLDYYRERAPKSVQIRMFKEQLDLASEVGLPVVVHNREATDDILDILEKWRQELISTGSSLAYRPGVLHSFSGDVHDASRAVASGFKIGITGPITFKNSRTLQEVVSSGELDDILIETDAPFLTPHPHRGKRNEPAYVLYIAQKISQIKNIPWEDVAKKTARNADELFHW